jgi:RNA exonuclease 4
VTRTQTKPENQRKTSSRPHDAPMKKRDIYFALDCEMVGTGRGAVDSALARVSIINWDNEIVLDTFVQVSDDVTDYRTYISGIRKEDIESISAMPLNEVRSVVQNILRGKILIGHGLENDLKALGIKHPWCDMRDTAAYRPLMKEVLPGMFAPKKLRDLALDVLGLKIQEPGRAHNPVEDAKASMDIYKHERTTWETLNTERVKVAAMLTRQNFSS